MGQRSGLRTSAIVIVAGLGLIALAGTRLRGQGRDLVLTPTGRELSPIGSQTQVGSFPANMALSPDGRWIVVTTTGYRQYLSVLDSNDGRLVSQIAFNGQASVRGRRKSSLYVGLAFAETAAPPFELYVSRGPEDRIGIYGLNQSGTLTETGRDLDIRPEILKSAARARPSFAAGIALNSNGMHCYVANNDTSPDTGLNGSFTVLDVPSGRVLGKVATPGFPFAVAAVTRGQQADRKVYVSSERDGVVSVIDVADPAHPGVTRNLATGDHPVALLLDRAQERLFVANAGSDTVSIVDTRTDRITDVVPLRPHALRSLPGATPLGLALAPDQKHLYVALADMNAVAVLSLTGRRPVVSGYIPTGWYPTAVVVTQDGARLVVASAKGVQAHNPNGAPAGPSGAWGRYTLSILEGTVAVLPIPDEPTLAALSRQTLDHLRAAERPASQFAREPRRLSSAIKHVIYIIKENRTYDQVLGDLHQGNGDASLTLFGRDVTPNQHALAERFVLLDNFYDCAEVSADGWNWSVSGMVSEYTARNVPFNYSGRGREYDFEGENNSVPVDLIGLPDVARAPAGYIWDNCLRHGVTFRDYGFFNIDDDRRRPDGGVLAVANAPSKQALVGRTDVDFLRFDLSYADSDAWAIYGAPSPHLRQTFGAFRSPSRFSEWKREFDQYVRDGDLPAFVMVRFPRNHTAGTSPGENSPRAMVADNDFAVGQLVEAISKSRYWKETAIFIVEDDAQDGFDHVDSHRAPCLVISPSIPRATVDHRFYNTDSVLRTMETLLGLPPMNQYDALAPLFGFFAQGTPPNAEPYSAILPAREIVTEVNARTAYRAPESAMLDFRTADRVPDAVLNDILWHSVKGAEPTPPIRHRVIASAHAAKDNDD